MLRCCPAVRLPGSAAKQARAPRPRARAACDEHLPRFGAVRGRGRRLGVVQGPQRLPQTRSVLGRLAPHAQFARRRSAVSPPGTKRHRNNLGPPSKSTSAAPTPPSSPGHRYAPARRGRCSSPGGTSPASRARPCRTRRRSRARRTEECPTCLDTSDRSRRRGPAPCVQMNRVDGVEARRWRLGRLRSGLSRETAGRLGSRRLEKGTRETHQALQTQLCWSWPAAHAAALFSPRAPRFVSQSSTS